MVRPRFPIFWFIFYRGKEIESYRKLRYSITPELLRWIEPRRKLAALLRVTAREEFSDHAPKLPARFVIAARYAATCRKQALPVRIVSMRTVFVKYYQGRNIGKIHKTKPKFCFYVLTRVETTSPS